MLEFTKAELALTNKECTLFLKILTVASSILFTTACTTGKLYYTNKAGERRLACNVEFVGLPSVDKFAVEYALSFCAQKAVNKGHVLDSEQEYLVNIDRTIVPAPCGKSWDHDLAKTEYNNDRLTKKQYGYIVAHIDLGLAQVNSCSS